MSKESITKELMKKECSGSDISLKRLISLAIEKRDTEWKELLDKDYNRYIYWGLKALWDRKKDTSIDYEWNDEVHIVILKSEFDKLLARISSEDKKQ